MNNSQTTNTRKNISEIFWDYKFSEDDLSDLLSGRISKLGYLDRDKLLIRMLNYLNWYDFIKFVPFNLFVQIVDKKFLEKINDKQLAQGLSFVNRYLHKKIISAAE